MEKLEKILHAEDAARAEAEDARTAAAATLSEARAKATELLRSGREDIRANAATHRDEVLTRAHQSAADLADSAEAEARAVIADAATRTEDALGAVLQVLKGL